MLLRDHAETCNCRRTRSINTDVRMPGAKASVEYLNAMARHSPGARLPPGLEAVLQWGTGHQCTGILCTPEQSKEHMLLQNALTPRTKDGLPSQNHPIHGKTTSWGAAVARNYLQPNGESGGK
jgi:hypothetical protein